jgi:hypothetical protein
MPKAARAPLTSKPAMGWVIRPRATASMIRLASAAPASTALYNAVSESSPSSAHTRINAPAALA